MSNEKAVEMFVGGLVLDPNTQAPVVVLKDESGSLYLPIWIGMAEATSIATAIKQVPMERPLTHDLMHEIFGQIGISVQRVIITELKESTYYAELVLSWGDKALILDSRPSDAIALAVRTSAPILVTQTVLEQAKITFNAGAPTEEAGTPKGEEQADQPKDAANTDFTPIDKDRWQEILEQLDPDDFKYKV